MKKLSLIILALAASLGTAHAQLDPPVQKPIVWPHRPALSPDGTLVAFTYRGDIWTALAGGTIATRLTDHLDLDTIPLFSPDGQWIAFSTLRNGNYDVYAIPVTGGTPRQLTFSSAGEVGSDWSPDGKSILFSAARNAPVSTLVAVDVRTLRFRELGTDYKGITYPSYSPDGKQVFYCELGFPYFRPRYTGSRAAQVWSIDVATGKRRRVLQGDRQQLWPHMLPDNRTLICVTTGETTPSTTKLGETLPKWMDNEQRTPNLWAFDPDGKGRLLTHFVGGSVAWPSVARRTGDIVFEYGGDIYLLRHGAQQPVKLVLYAPTDDKENAVHQEILTSGAEEAEISPDGKTIAFGIKGEIWSVPVDKPKTRSPDDATRITNYAGWDGDFVWAPDGKRLIFLSDRDNGLSLYDVDLKTQATRCLWKGEDDAFHPQVTPDGKQIAFWVAGSKGGLFTMPIDGGEAKKLLDLPGTGAWGSGGREFSFSPDMQWLAFTKRAQYGTLDIWLMPAKGGTPVNVTRLNASHTQLRWSPDCKALFFQSDREGPGLYVLPLKKDDTPRDELDMKLQMPADKSQPKVEIDFQDIELRIRKHSSQNPDEDLAIGNDGTLYFLSGGDAWSVSYNGKETKRLTSGGGCGELRLQADGKKLLLIRNGALNLLTLAPNNPIANVAFSAVWDHDVNLERRAAFTQFWRGYNRTFYDENFHGRNWDAIRARYEPLLDGAGTREEFAIILNMMVGELECSHSEVSTGEGHRGPTTPHLGFTIDTTYDGPGLRIKDVPQRSPGSYEKTKLNPGEYVLQVNGKDVRADEYLYRTLNDRNGKDLELLVNKTASKDGARKVTYKALSWGEWDEIDYRNRLQARRQEVEKRSGGKVAYIHIRGMGGSNQTQFLREFYEYVIGKEAVIVDVRFNGGGNIADTLTSWLALKPYAMNRPRGGMVEVVPDRSWDKPMAVLINEASFSNAEMFPYDMKQTLGATLVGMPTPGYVIWTTGFPLVDGTVARMPGSGVWRKDGTPLEDNGQQPDIRVDLTADDWDAGRDPQLDAAVDALMKKQ